jgi:single-strand DNA-binding protein
MAVTLHLKASVNLTKKENIKMNGFNKVFILGRLGHQPELQTHENGQNFTQLSVATNTNKETEWFRVKAWGKTAENCSKYLQKGQGVMVEGYLSSYKIENKNGEKESRVGINALKVEFLPKNQQSSP